MSAAQNDIFADDIKVEETTQPSQPVVKAQPQATQSPSSTSSSINVFSIILIIVILILIVVIVILYLRRNKNNNEELVKQLNEDYEDLKDENEKLNKKLKELHKKHEVIIENNDNIMNENKALKRRLTDYETAKNQENEILGMQKSKTFTELKNEQYKKIQHIEEPSQIQEIKEIPSKEQTSNDIVEKEVLAAIN
jgi:uncharacterized protein HemX